MAGSKAMSARGGGGVGLRRQLPTVVVVMALLGAAGTALATTQPNPAAPAAVRATPLSSAPLSSAPLSSAPLSSAPLSGAHGSAPMDAAGSATAPVIPDPTVVLRLPGNPPARGAGSFG